jgi:predicted phosphodiesterase
MKRTKILLFGLLLLFVPATFPACGNDKTPFEKQGTGDSEKSSDYLRFIVISDTHFGNAQGEGPMVKVPKALKHLTAKTPKADALFVVGDITNDGRDDQYNQLLQVFNNRANVPEGLPVYFMMGNHDHFANEGVGTAERYLRQTGQPLHQYIIIKGYPFITISESGSDQNDFNNDAVQFLSEHLAKATTDYPGKPVFVFIHVPTVNTTYGSVTESGALPDGGWCTTRFRATLDNYPQAVVFSGHTHYPLGDPRSIYQDGFTAINTASTTYAEVEGDAFIGLKNTWPDGYENVTEGLIVIVKENGDVKLERWDTYRDEEIKPDWILRAPHDGTRFAYKNRTGGAAPTFGSDDPTVGSITTNACSVTFPQATDDEVVHHYKVEIVNSRNEMVKESVIFSGFYLNSGMPAELTVKFTGLSAKTSYTAKVTAYDSYRQPSQPISADFKTN